MHSIDMSGKVALVAGIANHMSIGWGIAKALHRAGARLILSHLNEREKDKISQLAAEHAMDDAIIPPESCDVQSDEQISRLFGFIWREAGRIDCFAHSMAFAPSEALKGRFVDTTRSDFHTALGISAYSMVAMAREAQRLMTAGGAMICMSYMASEKVFPKYNIMAIAKSALENITRYLAHDLGPNIRVNCISAGPLKTLSARGVPGLNDILELNRRVAPLKRNVTQDDIAATALYLLSDMSSGVTGEIIHVDCGCNIMGVAQ